MARRDLTLKERRIARLVAHGETNRQIACVLGVSVSTVKQGLTSIMLKWDCDNRTQVAVAAMRRGVVVQQESEQDGASSS